ncbi:MAG: metallophosphoesterase family protein [Spirochaetales bacterium]|nr:metallophosphoesterase family protein [Spirochaetales bacterium]
MKKQINEKPFFGKITLLLIFLLAGFSLFAQNYDASDICLTPGKTMAEMNFNWYSKSLSESLVQLALKTDMTGDFFPEKSSFSFRAYQNKATPGFYSNKANVKHLKENTSYVYRLGDGKGLWSEVYGFTSYGAGDFAFLVVGDPQIGTSDIGQDTASWSHTLDKALGLFPEIAFIMSVGDQVETGSVESQFSGFFAPRQLRDIPIAPALGNHELGSPNTAWHFNLPKESDYGLTPSGIGNYYYRYGEALFMVLNSNNFDGKAHKAFIQQTISLNSDANWRIIMFHHDIYGSGSHTTEPSVITLRMALYPVFDQYKIDMVFTGHDHSYARTHVMRDDKPRFFQKYDKTFALVDPDGTLYLTLNSATGSKYYSLLTGKPDFIATCSQLLVPSFSYVSIKGNRLDFKTFRVDTMALMDSVSIVKTSISQSEKKN